MNWISVKDDLPWADDYYLVYLANGSFCIGHWTSDDFWSTGYYVNRLNGVTHWAYLEAP